MPEMMQTVAGVAPMVGGLLGAKGQIDAGKQQYSDAMYEAHQLRENAKKAMVQGSVDIENKDREFDYLASRALAVAGHSGGGVSDPAIEKLLSDIAGEGAIEKSRLLYGAQEESDKYNQAAAAKKISGKRGLKASRIAAASTVLTGAATGASNWFGAGRFLRDSTGAFI